MIERALVTGAGGFVGGHLVGRLLRDGCEYVRAVDIKPIEGWFQLHPAADNRQGDLSTKAACDAAVEGVDAIYNLAADMGGIGFIEHNKATCMLSVLINTHLLLAATEQRLERYFFSSSACVYTQDRQASADLPPLKESDAYPAAPEPGYGWEKLFSERMCQDFSEDFGIRTRVARYHNVYGPHCAWAGGREKAPAAICRKVAEAKRSGRPDIDIWGDGEQTRSFTFVDDCVAGTRAIMDSDVEEPINLGSGELFTINELVDVVEAIAGVKLRRRYDLAAPQGVRGRNSDNATIRRRLGWEPRTPLTAGLEPTYRWIHDQLAEP